MKYNSLEEALNMNSTYAGKYKLPFRRNDLFKKNGIDLEYFNMSFTQRMTAFFGCLVVAIFMLSYSFLSIIRAVVSPTRFALPYAISNYLFFWMFGFLFGFKTYLRKTFSEKKRIYTLPFLLLTAMTIYTSLFWKINYFMIAALSMLQMCSFVALVVAFLPGGSDGMSSIVSLMFKR